MPQVTSTLYEDPQIWVFDTLVAMRANEQPGATYAICILTGRAAAFAADGGLYSWNGASAAADNGTTVIQPTAVTGNGRWIRIVAP